MNFSDELIIARYKYHTGSMPPPHYHEYTITVTAEMCTAEMEYYPDYPQHHPPVWKVSVKISPDQIDRLMHVMQSEGIFLNRAPDEEPRCIGGSLDYLTVQLQDRAINFSRTVSAHFPETVKAIKALIPEPQWEKIIEQKNEFDAAYDNHTGE